jgi:transposase
MTEAPGTIVRGFKARLYPTAERADRLNQWAGSLRFLWNRLLETEQAEYAISKKFIPKAELQRRTVTMKTANGTCTNTDMKNLNRRTFTCAECGHVEGRDRNAARGGYGESQ